MSINAIFAFFITERRAATTGNKHIIFYHEFVIITIVCKGVIAKKSTCNKKTAAFFVFVYLSVVFCERIVI